jgi:hypothetical protein
VIEKPHKQQSFLKRLDDYWFGHGSPVALGVFRILIGFLAITNFLMLLPDFDAWFTERGYVPAALAKVKMPQISATSTVFGSPITLPFDVPRINLLWGVTDSRITALVFAMTLVAALLTMLGLWTRVSTILLALGTVSIHTRNAYIVHGGDTVLRIMVLYLAMAPCGLSCSLDRIIGLWKGKIGPAVPRVSLWSQRLISYNVALVYFTTFWHKMGGTYWRNGTATWYPARLHEFDRFWMPSFLTSPPFIYVSTYGTLITELSLGTLVFYKPLRKWVLLAGLVMHAGIEYSMNIPLFAFVICSCYVTFYSGEEVSEWARRLGERLKRFRVQIGSPQGTEIVAGPGNALEALDTFDLIDYAPGDQPGWIALDAAGNQVSAAKASWTRSPAAWILGWIPGFWARILNKATAPLPASSISAESRKKAVVR